MNIQKQKSTLYRNNYWFLVLEGAFFMGAIGFYNAGTVIPVFIDSITGSKQLVGLTLTLGSAFMYIFRLFIGPFVPYIKNQTRFTTLVMFLTRPLLLIPSIFIFVGRNQAAVIALVAAYAALWACDGIVVPVWSEVLANSVDESRHGRLLGYQMLLGGLAGIGAGILINIFLSNPLFDSTMAYGWIFLVGGILATLSCIMMALTKDAPHPYKTGKVHIIAYFRDLPKHLKNEKGYAKMMQIQLLFLSATMCNPFFILFASENLAISQNIIAKLILAQLIGVPLGGWFWGYICDRFGSHNGIRLAGFNILLPAVLSLLTLVFRGISPMFFMVPVLFLVGISGGIWTCYFVYTIQTVRPESRSACIVLTSVITLPTAFTGYLAGYISEKAGFVSLFIVCITLVLPGLILAFRLPSANSIREKEL